MTSSSYYYNPIGKKDDSELLARIERITLEYSRYGYRRVTAQLRRDGVAVNHKKVLRTMRENDLTCRVKRRFVRTTDSKHGLPIYPNLLQDFNASAPTQAWVADITYVRLIHHSDRGVQYASKDYVDTLRDAGMV